MKREGRGGGERRYKQKNRAKERETEAEEAEEENGDPTRPTGSPASARISCSACNAPPILRGSH